MSKSKVNSHLQELREIWCSILIKQLLHVGFLKHLQYTTRESSIFTHVVEQIHDFVILVLVLPVSQNVFV